MKAYSSCLPFLLITCDRTLPLFLPNPSTNFYGDLYIIVFFYIPIDFLKGTAESSAIAYSLAESAKANNLKPYDYFMHLLEEIPKHMDDASLDFLDDLLPWSDALPETCRKNLK